MPAVRYLVPYEIAVHANDLASGKPITNLFYTRCSTAGPAAPPAYGANVPASSTTQVLTSFKALWETNIVALMNQNYKLRDYTLRAIIGKQYSTPMIPLAAVIAGAPVTVQTSTAHGYSTGNRVSISGVTSPTGVNGLWIITVIDSTTFELDGSTAGGSFTGAGFVQKVQGALQLMYADVEVLLSTTAGGVTGDMLPLFSTASIRRISLGAGRHFRARLSVSPWSEVDQLNGRWTATMKSNMVTALGVMITGAFNNNATPPDAMNQHIHLVFSKELALQMQSPFTDSFPFGSKVNTFSMQPNLGSLVRRKPKLTVAIA